MKKLFTVIFFTLLSVNAFCDINIQVPENVKLKGDVRAKWTSEFSKPEEHVFKTEANLGCEYLHDDAWVSVKMKAQTSNGRQSIICLDKAFLGHTFLRGEKSSIGLELGRNKMDSMFDSKLQFNSYFNGFHFIYSYSQPELFEMTLHGGPHIIHSDKNHYGWIGEVIFNKIAQSPFTVKYSFTDWNPQKLESVYYSIDDPIYTFNTSQLTVSYDMGPAIIYAAYLLNHREKDHNEGYYFGCTMGKIQRKGDISVDVNFQSCDWLAVCPMDVKGFKKGMQFKAIYALTSSLNLEGKFSLYDDFFGVAGNKRLEMSAIYYW